MRNECFKHSAHRRFFAAMCFCSVTYSRRRSITDLTNPVWNILKWRDGSLVMVHAFFFFFFSWSLLLLLCVFAFPRSVSFSLFFSCCSFTFFCSFAYFPAGACSLLFSSFLFLPFFLHSLCCLFLSLRLICEL